jgi:hypothetical protein
VKAGRYATEVLWCDTLLLDDGFQYWKLRGRRLDVVSSGDLIPRGAAVPILPPPAAASWWRRFRPGRGHDRKKTGRPAC